MPKFTKECWLTHEHPNKGKSTWNKGKKDVYSEETRKKISLGVKKAFVEGRLKPLRAMLGRHHSEETRTKMSIDRRERDDEINKKMGRTLSRLMVEGKISKPPSNKGKKWSKNTLIKRLDSLKKTTQTKEYRKKVSELMKNLWKNPIFREKITKAKIDAIQSTPNKKERLLGQLIRQATKTREYRFNAKHGFIIIDGLVPDFVNVNGQKKCIELFGDYWHDSSKHPNMPQNRTEHGRKEALARFGWNCLVIWEKELKNPEAVIDKIKEFNLG